MLKKYALEYYREGYNCSQCILKAAEKVYKVKVTKEMIKMCSAVNMGFGTGGICSTIIGGIMVFGLVFDENTAKSMRLKLIVRFSEKYGCTECARLQKKVGGCEKLISDTADMIEMIIKEHL
ncbi:MAG: C-GCAxxG-C-C family protein [Firmicutes bacterium]|nr:C-GCAxxG-C-C family protein [Bacillota bacterium]